MPGSSINYPATLPYVPMQEGYQVLEAYTPPVVTQVEDGPDLVREWSFSNWSKIQQTMQFRKEMYDTWHNFVVNDLVRGRKRFMMPVGRLNQPLPWTSKLVYLDQGKFSGPTRQGESHVRVSFILCVLDW